MQPRHSMQTTHQANDFWGPNQYTTTHHSTTSQKNNFFGSVLPSHPDFPEPLKLNGTRGPSVMQQQAIFHSPAHGTTAAPRPSTASFLGPAPGLLNHMSPASSPRPRSNVNDFGHNTWSPLRPPSANARTNEWASHKANSLATSDHSQRSLNKFNSPRDQHRMYAAEHRMNVRYLAQQNLPPLMGLVDRVAGFRIQQQLLGGDDIAVTEQSRSLLQEMDKFLDANQSIRYRWIFMLVKGAMGNLSILEQASKVFSNQ